MTSRASTTGCGPPWRRYFRGDPWVLGYDPFNEPFSTSLVTSGDEKFDGQLECFYTGRSFIGTPSHGAAPITCAPGVPAVGLIPAVQTADPGALVFYEPDIFSSRGSTNFVGPMPFANLVFNVHVYCGQRSGKTGNPTNIAACAAQEQRSLTTRSEDRTDLGTPAQPGGPAWFLSEFGATSNPTLLDRLTTEADRSLVGWAYWSWKFYADPTGSSAEGLVAADGSLRLTAVGPFAHVSSSDRRKADVAVLRSDERGISPGLRSGSRSAGPHGDIRPDPGPLPERVLCPGFGRKGDLQAG